LVTNRCELAFNDIGISRVAAALELAASLYQDRDARGGEGGQGGGMNASII
jgi:hypothetical protein